MRSIERLLTAVVLVGVSACTAGRASSVSTSSTSSTTAASSKPLLVSPPSSQAPTSSSAPLPAPGSPVLRTLVATPFDIEGDSQAVCSAAITKEDPNHYTWPGVVLIDTRTKFPGPTPRRWIVCYGDGASGQGLVALVSEDSHHWRYSPLGFGRVYHAGDHPEAAALNNEQASITYDSLMTGEHGHAFTVDGGRTWTVVDLNPEW
jgi:hypothetical protein